METDRVRDQEISETKQIRAVVRQISRIAQDRQRRIDTVMLLLGVLTGGSLWVAIITQFQAEGVWIGAIASTLLALLGGYSKIRNYVKLSLEALALQDK